MEKNRYDYDYVNAYFKNNNMTLVSKEYKNVRSELEYTCDEHPDKGVMKIKFGNMLRRNSKCPYCMIEEGNPPQHLPLDIYKDKTEQAGLIFVSQRNKKSSFVITFRCPKHENKGDQEAMWGSIISGHCVCKYCNGYRDHEDFEDIVRNNFPTLKIIGRYQGARKRIEVACEKHNYTWSPCAYNLLSGFGCPKCGYEKTGLSRRTSIEEKTNTLLSINKDIILINVPETTVGLVKCQCKKCKKIWEAPYSNMVNPSLETGCPYCSMSKGEKKTYNLLIKWDIPFETQKIFDGCKDVFHLRFDFFLPYTNTCIEYQGEQHYYDLGISGRKKDTKKTWEHDGIKKNYCELNNINYIEIPYWEFDDLEYFLFDRLVEVGEIIEICA